MNKYYIHFLADSPIFGLYRYISDKYSEDADQMTEYLFRTVVDNYTKNTHEAYLKVQGAMNLLLSPFFSQVSADRHNLLKFEGVLRHIDQNYKRNIPLSELAGIMNISTMYFSNYFKQVFHISPKQYILNKRLSESQRLLLESEMSVKEIAYAVGFENESYFYENLPDFVHKHKCKDFLNYNKHVDWIFGKMPRKNIDKVIKHSFEICYNIIYIMKFPTLFSTVNRIKNILEFGGIKQVIMFPDNRCAVWFQKSYNGDTKFLEYKGDYYE
jgi:AraC-like DNA-binding protein